ncbi:hypothetical protein [Ureibacillus endophyticus]|uniref:Uncharacterized protein n=1 Tax=Ureibacillus endophyticus TaxID=1978490 RepID=A0A494Z362_9BACL|nr:hypothetical protein [Lysinibacillus endophyticus]RKQ16948.1 hypothetical protein D8M03_08710 [Lysinibacillus endophyticus]
MTNFYSFHGTVTAINDFFTGQNGEGCTKMYTLQNEMGAIVNFVVSPTTFFVDHEIVRVGDQVTGYYNGDLPAILIYPPQYPAIVMVKENPQQNVKVDYFNNQLLSSDGDLKLNLSPNTRIRLTNGQPFSLYPGNRDLIVLYTITTRSIPAQTTPQRIIVLC